MFDQKMLGLITDKEDSQTHLMKALTHNLE